MNDWFEWNGVRSTTKGIYVTEQPAFSIPNERVTNTTVLGKAGSLTTLEGKDVYEDQILSATCLLKDINLLPNLGSFLKGSGTVTFANRPGGYYNARITNQISFEKVVRGNEARSFVVNFRCKPFWYQAGVADITLTSSGQSIVNPGSVFSEPLITLTGSGDITLMVGTQMVELEGLTDSIVMDTSLMEAYKGTASMNGYMTGEFPVLNVGSNAISWSGSVTSVVIKPRWRYLV